jgi:ABC-type transport system substrate-binding protein
MELARNENFLPLPPIKRILIRIVPDAATRTALLERGAVDYAMRLPERSLQALAKNPAVEIVRAKANFIPYVGPVETNEIMAKTKVRQAMAYATPYDEIHQKVYFGEGRLIKSIFVEAAICAGNSRLRAAFFHVMPNALAPAMVHFSTTVGFSILLTAGLSFVGAGVPPPTPELGLMIQVGAQNMITGQWWTALFPGLCLAVTVLAFSLFGDNLRIFLDPTNRR